jgi:hypothetical protein
MMTIVVAMMMIVLMLVMVMCLGMVCSVMMLVEIGTASGYGEVEYARKSYREIGRIDDGEGDGDCEAS